MSRRPKRIVIIPSFASSHFLKCWIPNMIEVLNPDIIIVNEGLMPNGPEDKGHIDAEFRKKWCFKDTNLGFDWIETNLQWANEARFDNSRISINQMNYRAGQSANDCFIEAVSTFHQYQPEVGDLIFPLEPDAFLWEGDINTIEKEISTLNPGHGISCKWVDFLETQYYTEAINQVQPKYRRFCYCFDNMENYRKAMVGFMSQDYPLLKKVDSFFVRHYCWFQPEPWKQLRYDLIYRSDPQYWKNFNIGLNEIRLWSNYWKENDMKKEKILIRPSSWNDFDRGLSAIRRNSEFYVRTFYEAIPDKPFPSDKVIIRPSRQDEGRFAQFIDVPHPKAIQNHPNFVK